MAMKVRALLSSVVVLAAMGLASCGHYTCGTTFGNSSCTSSGNGDLAGQRQWRDQGHRLFCGFQPSRAKHSGDGGAGTEFHDWDFHRRLDVYATYSSADPDGTGDCEQDLHVRAIVRRHVVWLQHRPGDREPHSGAEQPVHCGGGDFHRRQCGGNSVVRGRCCGPEDFGVYGESLMVP